MMTDQSELTLSQYREIIREDITESIKTWKIAEATYILAMDDMRRRHARAVLDRFFWLDRYLSSFDDHLRYWVKRGYKSTWLLESAEVAYGGSPLHAKDLQVERDRIAADKATWTCKQANEDCEGDVTEVGKIRKIRLCSWHYAERRGLVIGPNRIPMPVPSAEQDADLQDTLNVLDRPRPDVADGTPVDNPDITCADWDFSCQGTLRWYQGRIICIRHYSSLRPPFGKCIFGWVTAEGHEPERLTESKNCSGNLSWTNQTSHRKSGQGLYMVSRVIVCEHHQPQAAQTRMI